MEQMYKRRAQCNDFPSLPWPMLQCDDNGDDSDDGDEGDDDVGCMATITSISWTESFW